MHYVYVLRSLKDSGFYIATRLIFEKDSVSMLLVDPLLRVIAVLGSLPTTKLT
jgi:hypothetical protein